MSANFPANSIGPVPENVPQDNWAPWLLMIARALNWLIRRSAATTLTLTNGVTTTTLTDDRIGPTSHIDLVPLTAHAAALAPYVSARGMGTATITHANTAQTDQNFSVKID